MEHSAHFPCRCIAKGRPCKPVETPAFDDGGMHKILVAYHGGDAARRALYAAAQLARAIHAQVGVISVVPLYPNRGPSTPAPWDDATKHLEDLEEAEAVFRASGIEPELISLTGEPAILIEREADARGYDTIVMGGKRKGWFQRLLTGSVVTDVVTRTRATVVVVP
jgi:nucleotide-binding universal stress UspA family protein